MAKYVFYTTEDGVHTARSNASPDFAAAPTAPTGQSVASLGTITETDLNGRDLTIVSDVVTAVAAHPHEATPTDTEAGRVDLRASHETILTLSRAVEDLHSAHSAASINSFREVLLALHRTRYRLFHATGFTYTQKTAWLEADANGPSDLTFDPDDPHGTVSAFCHEFESDTTITVPAVLFFRDPSAPTTTKTFSAALSFSNSFDLTTIAALPSDLTVFSRGAWIDDWEAAARTT